jgi:hypothetical protein
MKTFTEKMIDHVIKQSEPIQLLAAEADSVIAELKRRLNTAQADLDRLKSAQCPTCGGSLPADGVCAACAALAWPETAEAGFKAGALALAQAVASVRSFGRFVDSAEGFLVLVDAVVKNHLLPDRRQAAQAAAETYSAVGFHCLPPQPRVNYSDLLYSKEAV